jgi:hypothetical protein
MSRGARAVAAALAGVVLVTATTVAAGVGDATWTPATSTTSATESSLFVDGDSIVYRNESVWDREQADGLARYLEAGVRYTHEINDRSGRLSATGFWASNHPDPAYDRDDDDGDGRWEETEIIAGGKGPEAGERYASLVQYSRWRGKRVRGRCEWAWDRRRGQAEVLAQLSRDLLGEWQAERYTLSYDSVPYPRVGLRPELPAATARPRCRDERPGVNQAGYVVTFSRPLSWAAFRDRVSAGSAKWTAFEAIGSHPQDGRTWTCGGPVDDSLRLAPCREMGVRIDGISAAVGFVDEVALRQLRDDPAVAAVEPLRDALTGLLHDVGFGVGDPGLTVNDRYWELVLTD